MNDISIKELNETITRLINENQQWRNKFEELEAILRLRDNDPAELSLKHKIISLLDQKDKLYSIVEENKQKIKKLSRFIIYNDIENLKKEINLFILDINKQSNNP